MATDPHAAPRSALWAAAAVGVQVGAATVASRFAIEQAGPATLAFLRYLIGAACLLPFVLATRWPRIPLRDLLVIAALGTVQFAVLIALLNVGLQHVPAARAALILATMPLATMVLAALGGRERISMAAGAGVLLTILGVAIALGEKAWRAGPGPDQWFGDLAILAGTVAGAACSVLYRPYLGRYPTLAIGMIAMLASVAALGVAAAVEMRLGVPLRLDASGWGAVLFIGMSSGIGYFLWLWALGRAPATRVTVFMALGPLTASIIGWALLGEPLSLAFGAALLCVCGGVWLAHQ